MELNLDRIADRPEAHVVRDLLNRCASPDGTLWISEGGQRIGLVVRLPAQPVVQEEHGSYGVVS
jgi:hypothetical protein